MSTTATNDDPVARHVYKLRQLKQRSVRFDLLVNLKSRRQQATVEPGDAGLPRPPFQLIPPVAGNGDPVLVVPNEIIVPEAEVDDVIDFLGEQFDVQELCDGVRKLAARRPLSLLSTLSRLRGANFRASANHVAMLGGTAKGGATPKATTATPTPLTSEPSTTPSEGPMVVVIDTGIDRGAQDRTDSWLRWVTPIAADRDIDPLDLLDPRSNLGPDGRLDLGAGHGTFVAGVISQVEPRANVTMLRAIDTDGVCSEAQIADAICRAGKLFREYGNGRGVLNLSLGIESADGREPIALRAALDTLPPEVLVVAAAGNSAAGIPLWPAASKRVLGVASLTRNGTPSDWSNFGSWVDFAARGEGVVSTFVVGKETKNTGDIGDPFDVNPDEYFAPNPYAVWTGTSFSTPKVTARLATLLTDDPALTRAGAQQKLQSEGILSTEYGYRLPAL
jgi:hypothetical protein